MNHSLNVRGLPDSKLGQSNSGIELIEFANNRVAVKKFTMAQDGRLQAQFEKHVHALSLDIPGIQIPSVLSPFQDNSYVMQYMPGTPLGFFLESASQNEVSQISLQICAFLQYSLDSSTGIGGSNHLDDKLASISSRLSHLPSDPFSRLLSALQKRIANVQIPVGWNHGDFSFENLLIVPSTLELVLLDFLDSPFESPLIDLGRFWLDAYFGWWGSGLNPSSNSFLNSQYLARSVSDFCTLNEVPQDSLVIFASLAALRIYPYTKDPVRMAFLKKASRQLLEML